MGIVGGYVSGSVCKSVGSCSGSSSSSQSSNSHRENEDKDIEPILDEDNYSPITEITRVAVPSTNDKATSDILNVYGKIFVGSKFVHEGLLVKLKSGNYFVCQTYPIQFKKFKNEEDALKEIKSYWAINKNAEYVDKKKVDLNKVICIDCLHYIVDDLPNRYDLFTYNCQDFCSRIIERLKGIEGKECRHINSPYPLIYQSSCKN